MQSISSTQMITQRSSSTINAVQQEQIDRKYGMFIHFGINTFNDTQWSNGTLPVSSYNPTGIDADQWVQTAHDAGMNYVILTVKHHEGFCLWDSQYTDYTVAHSPYKEDVVKAVSDACHKYGLDFGIYYSLWDRHEPCYLDDHAYTEYMKNQLTELLDGKYGKIVELWLDGGWEKPSENWHLDELYHHVKTLQPHCSFGVNITIGEYNTQASLERYHPVNQEENDPMKYFPSDFRLADPLLTREGKYSDPKVFIHNDKPYYLPFEATICIRNMTYWFWGPAYPKTQTLTPAFIAEKYHHLTEQGNLLIVNSGPNPDGVLEEYDRQTLFEAARMLNIAKGDALLSSNAKKN